MSKKQPPVIFIRAEGFYSVEIKPGETIQQHVDLNPGTLRVEDIHGNILWPIQ